jgi:hypothetical protein
MASAVILLSGSAVVTVAFAADEVEWIRGGGFEQGFGNFEIYRYPRFFQGEPGPFISRVENKALSGRYSLLLPGMDAGGYRFVFPKYDLLAGAEYRLSFQIQSTAPVRVQVELFSRAKNISRQTTILKKGDSTADLILRASRDSNHDKAESADGYRIVLRFMSGADLLIDELSLSGPGRTDRIARPWVELTPDKLLGIYGIGETGTMQVGSAVDVDASITYRIIDVVRDIPVNGSEPRMLGQDKSITLITRRRGAYRVEIYAGEAGGSMEALASRRYVVIDRDYAKPVLTRYGIAMEEHGQKTHVDARIEAAELYRLAAEIGAGSVRIFTLAMPDIVSVDGISYDFHQIDKALELCDRYGLEPLVELGSNLPNRIPDWLRTSKSRPDTIDLERGLATKKLKIKFSRSGAKQYLDLAAYEQYLQTVFKHLGDKVRYFEIWNEPGHKFLPEDFLKIARLTRKVQQEHAPHAKLVGYTSTKLPGKAGSRPSADKLPGFLDAMLSIDHGESIDVLSYHSAHAYKFLEEGQEKQGDETGYVDLLRVTLDKNRIKRNLHIWDTERGIPWASDRVSSHESEMDSLVVVRRLPGIHAASLASSVEKLFWFYMDSSTSTIAKPTPRYGLFDANLEPQPHIAAYDAMTHLIGDSRFVRRVDHGDGLRVYFFENVKGTTVIAFNWRGHESSFNFEFPGGGFTWLDVMGNKVMAEDESDLLASNSVKVNGWPGYFVFSGTPAARLSISVLGN